MLSLLDATIERLRLRSVPPFCFNAGLGVVSVAGGLLAPDLFGRSAGSLLVMQYVVLFPMTFVAVCLAAAAVDRQDPAQKQEHRTVTRWFTTPVMVIGFLLSFKVGGIFGPIEFVALTGATYLGAIRLEHGVHEVADICVRTAVAWAVLLSSVRIGGLGSNVEDWVRDAGAVKAAAFYFGALTALEAAGFYAWAAPKVLDAARKMKRTT